MYEEKQEDNIISIYNNIINVYESNIEQLGETCYISLIDPKFNLDNVVFYFDVQFDMSKYTCDNVVVSPIEDVQYEVKNVIFAGQVQLDNIESNSVTFNFLNGSEIALAQQQTIEQKVSNIKNIIDLKSVKNNVKTNISYIDTNTVGKSEDTTNPDYEIVEQQTLTVSVINNVVATRTVKIAYCEKHDDITSQEFEAVKSVLKYQMQQEFDNLNEMKYMYYGANIYGFKDSALVPIEFADSNKNYVIQLGEERLVVAANQRANCTGKYVDATITPIADNTVCVESCSTTDSSTTKILIDDFYCTLGDNSGNYIYDETDQKYYTYRQTIADVATDGACQDGKILIQVQGVSKCVEYCPHNYDTKIESETIKCELPESTSFYQQNDNNQVTQLVDNCLIFATISASDAGSDSDTTTAKNVLKCLTSTECNTELQNKNRQWRSCVEDTQCKYQLGSNDKACVNDCALFGVEPTSTTDSKVCTSACQATFNNVNQICVPCFGTSSEKKIVSTQNECKETIEKGIYYKYEKFSGVIVRVQQADCGNDSNQNQYMAKEVSGAYECTDKTTCKELAPYLYDSVTSNVCVQSCGVKGGEGEDKDTPKVWYEKTTDVKQCIDLTYCEIEGDDSEYNKLATENQCVKSCGENYYYYKYTDSSYKCTTDKSCNDVTSTYPALELTAGQCVDNDTCINALHIIVKEQCQYKISATQCSNYNDDNKTYILKDDEDNLCEVTLTCKGENDTPYISADKKSCVASCGKSSKEEGEQPYLYYVQDQESICLEVTQCKDSTYKYRKEQNGEECVNTCGNYQIVSTDDICVEKCTGEYAKPTATENKVCDSTCTYYSTADESICVDGDCASTTNYTLSATIGERTQCVASCPANSLPYTLENTCVDKCGSEKFLDIINKTCVDKCGSEKGYYYLYNDGNYTCSNTNMKCLYTTNSDNKSLSYISETDKGYECVENCGNNVWIKVSYDKVCQVGQTSCPSGDNSFTTKISDTNIFCDTKCGQSGFTGFTLKASVEGINYCVAQCGADIAKDLPYKQGSQDIWCVATCGEKEYANGNVNPKVCTSDCTSDYYHYTYAENDMRCTTSESCEGIKNSEEKGLSSLLNDNECIESCTGKNQLGDNTKICYTTCPTDTLLLVGANKCYQGTTCPSGYKSGSEANTCDADDCYGKPYMSAEESSTCVAQCTTGYWYQKETIMQCTTEGCDKLTYKDMNYKSEENDKTPKQCIAIECNEKNYYQENTSTTYCVEQCSTLYYQVESVRVCTSKTTCADIGTDFKQIGNTNQCTSQACSTIKGFVYQEDNQCVSGCSTAKKYIDSGVCSNTCGEKYVTSDSDFTCTESCGDNKMWYTDSNNQKVCRNKDTCEANEISTDKKECKTCADEIPYIQNNVCVEKCTGEFAKPVSESSIVCDDQCNFKIISQEPQQLQCISQESCQDSEMKSQYSEARFQCVTKCSESLQTTLIYVLDKQCVASCGKVTDSEQDKLWYINAQQDRQCVDSTSCQDIAASYLSVEGSTQCVTDCTTVDKFQQDKTCIAACTGDYATPFEGKIVEEVKQCMENDQCQTQQLKVQLESRIQCVQSCEDIEDSPYIQNGACVAVCDDGYELNENECVIKTDTGNKVNGGLIAGIVVAIVVVIAIVVAVVIVLKKKGKKQSENVEMKEQTNDAKVVPQETVEEVKEVKEEDKQEEKQEDKEEKQEEKSEHSEEKQEQSQQEEQNEASNDSTTSEASHVSNENSESSAEYKDKEDVDQDESSN